MRRDSTGSLWCPRSTGCRSSGPRNGPPTSPPASSPPRRSTRGPRWCTCASRATTCCSPRPPRCSTRASPSSMLHTPTASASDRGPWTSRKRSNACSRWASMRSPRTTRLWPSRSATDSASEQVSREQDAQRGRDRFDGQPFVQADELPVDLHGHGSIAPKVEPAPVLQVERVAAANVASGPECARDDGNGNPGPEAVEGQKVQAAIQLGIWAQAHGAASEVGVRRRVLRDRQEESLAPFLRPGSPGNADARLPPVVAAEEDPEPRPHEEPVAKALLGPLSPLHLPHDGRVQPDAAAHGAVAVRNAAERHAPRRDVRVLHEPTGGLDRVVREDRKSV